ncbi:MAG: luciferase family protein [Acidimicrobiia bacterium]
MPSRTASEQIIDEVSFWPGIRVEEGDDLGETAFKLGNRELGHLHGDHAAHFSFPKSLWDQLAEQDRITHHPVFPDRRGPAARRIETDDDARDVVELFRLVYDRAVSRRDSPAEAEA